MKILFKTALVLMGDFNFPDVDWEHHTVNTNRSRKFLKHVGDNFLVQVLTEPTRKGALLVGVCKQRRAHGLKW